MQKELPRRLGLFPSTALNMIDMVGIGPFICLSFVMTNAGGMFLWAWIAGALLSLIDAMIWSELGTAFPFAGGTYNFLKEAYGKNSWGRLMGFMYAWQTLVQAPLVAASAAIGFSEYLGFLITMPEWQHKLVSASVIVLITILLYRKIEGIGKIGTIMWLCVVITIGWIIFAGVANGNFLQPIKDMNSGFSWKAILSFSFGQACVKAIYSYLGYYNVCHLGGEIINPTKNIPRSMFISVIGIAVLYLCMNISISSVIPWQTIASFNETQKEKYVVSLFMEKVYPDTNAGIIVTVLILIVALSSLFAVLLGYSRVSYAAAKDGLFLPAFAKLHPTKNFPYISLLVLGGLAFVFSLLFRMKHIIDGILAMRILIQFIGQAVGVVLLRKRNGTKHLQYRMPLYPLPVILVILMWVGIFIATGIKVIGFFLLVFLSGLIVYYFFVRKKQVKLPL